MAVDWFKEAQDQAHREANAMSASAGMSKAYDQRNTLTGQRTDANGNALAPMTAALSQDQFLGITNPVEPATTGFGHNWQFSNFPSPEPTPVQHARPELLKNYGWRGGADMIGPPAPGSIHANALAGAQRAARYVDQSKPWQTRFVNSGNAYNQENISRASSLYPRAPVFNPMLPTREMINPLNPPISGVRRIQQNINPAIIAGQIG